MTEEKQFQAFVKQILTYTDEKSLRAFLTAILTTKELTELPTRLQIIKMLKRGVPQRKIVDELGVGVATVTRGSKEIAKGNFSDIS